jgi:hypothetical protein
VSTFIQKLVIIDPTTGMLHTSPSSHWNKLTAPFVAKKRALGCDQWGRHPTTELDSLIQPLADWFDKVSPGDLTYPPWSTRRHVERALLQTVLSDSLQKEFAMLFDGKSFEELDALARSFHFDECMQREGLNKIMSGHAKIVSS